MPLLVSKDAQDTIKEKLLKIFKNYESNRKDRLKSGFVFRVQYDSVCRFICVSACACEVVWSFLVCGFSFKFPCEGQKGLNGNRSLFFLRFKPRWGNRGILNLITAFFNKWLTCNTMVKTLKKSTYSYIDSLASLNKMWNTKIEFFLEVI